MGGEEILNSAYYKKTFHLCSVKIGQTLRLSTAFCAKALLDESIGEDEKSKGNERKYVKMWIGKGFEFFQFTDIFNFM